MAHKCPPNPYDIGPADPETGCENCGSRSECKACLRCHEPICFCKCARCYGCAELVESCRCQAAGAVPEDLIDYDPFPFEAGSREWAA